MRIRYYGHVGQRTGYGRAATELCKALQRASVDLDIVPLSAARQKIHSDLLGGLSSCMRGGPQGLPPDAVIVHTLPYDCARVVAIEQLEAIGCPLIAQTTWELVSPPPALNLNVFDEVWVPSEQSRFPKSNRYRSDDTDDWGCVVVPHCFDEETLAQRQSERTRDLAGNRFAFYWQGAWTERKNPAGLIRAFTHAFGRQEEVELVLLSPGADLEFAMACASTGIDTKELPSIRLVPDGLTELEVMVLHTAGDCFVTASRGEAWNYPAFDAWLAGRSVIAPFRQGSSTFLDTAEYMLYGAREAIPLCDVRPGDKPGTLAVKGIQGMTARGTWFEPDLLELAMHMRNVYTNKHRRATPLNRYRFGYKAVAATAIARIEALLDKKGSP